METAVQGGSNNSPSPCVLLTVIVTGTLKNAAPMISLQQRVPRKEDFLLFVLLYCLLCLTSLA